MSIVSCSLVGLRRAIAEPRLLLLLWLVNLAFALPLALQMRSALAEGFGDGVVAERMVAGFDNAWYGEWEARSRGPEKSFGPAIIGPASVLGNLDAWWSGELFERAPEILVLATLQALVWLFLLGGVLDRLARPEVAGAPRLFAQGARSFPCLLRLALLAAPLYWLVYRFGRWLYGSIERSSREVTRESTVLFWMLLAALLVVALLGVVRMVFDYAKIVAIAAGERRALRSLRSALRLVGRYPLRTAGLHLAFGALFLLLVALYAVSAPGAGQASWLTVLATLLYSQLYLLAQLGLRLAMLGGASELQRTLVG